MKTKVLKFILTFLCVAFIYACSSPADLDTPTKNTPVDEDAAMIRPKISQISFEQNGVVTELEIEKSGIVIDTFKRPSRIWLNLSAKDKEWEERDYSKMFRIKSLIMYMDSMPITGSLISSYDTDYRKCWVKFLLNRGEKSKFDTLVDASTKPNYFEVNITHNSFYREFWVNSYAKIYDKRFSVAERDTIVKDSVLKERYDTVYIDNKMVIKKEKYWDIREIKLKLEEISNFPDSLIVNLKIKMKY